MTEYIITDKQLKTATEAYLEHELSRPITEVFISGDKLPEIVRCIDCKHTVKGYWCRHFGQFGDLPTVTPYGFCKWGERRGE